MVRMYDAGGGEGIDAAINIRLVQPPEQYADNSIVIRC